MAVPFRRMSLLVGMVAVAASLVTACGGGGSSNSAASSSTAKLPDTTVTSSGGSGGGIPSSKDTSKVKFINVWGGDPSGKPIDIYQSTGVETYTKVLSGLALGASSDWLDLNVGEYGKNFQVTKAGQKPDRKQYANNLQMNNTKKGQNGVVVIGWDPKAGPDQTGGTSFQSLNLQKDDVVKPVAGKVKVHASLVGADSESTVFLAVVGRGCLGDDGLNEPSVVFDPGPMQIQGIRSATSTGACAGEVQVPPVSISGKAGSSWIVALYGPAAAQKLTAVDVTPS